MESPQFLFELRTAHEPTPIASFITNELRDGSWEGKSAEDGP